jgi:hypothetical protein
LKIRHLSTIAITAAFLAISVILLPTTALMATLKVTPSSLQGWQTQASGTASVTFEQGPATPPLGVGSAELRVGSDGNSDAQLRHPGYAGTMLSNLTTLSYSTYVEQFGSGGQAPYLILNVDNNGDGVADDQLFFEPVYQNGMFSGDPVPNQCGANPNCVTLNQWQTWDARNGAWWALSAGTFGPPLITLNTYIAAHPNATIVNSSTGLGGVRIVVGFGAPAWNNFIGNVDNFTIGVSGNNTTYDFDPLVYDFRIYQESSLLSPGPMYFTEAKAGSDVQVRYSLGGFQGNNPYSSPPVSQQISCVNKAPIGPAQPIQTYPGDPYYNSLYDYYTTIWRTSSTWAGTCRRLTLSFNDGSTRTLDYRFK